MLKEIEKRILTSLILIPITFFFIYKGSFFFILFLIITFFVSSYEWIKLNKKKMIKLIGITFLFLSFYFAYLLRLELGFKIFLFIILISILTDIGGYIFGKTFKGPKLTKISPKKTYAGLIGSFFLSIMGGLIFVELIDLKSNLFLFSFILIVSLVSQVGDLVVSYFKRISKIKDTGKILPGHGGLLDRIDGIVFAIPFAYIYLKLAIVY